MQLTILGTGTAAPEPTRVCSGYLLEFAASTAGADPAASTVQGAQSPRGSEAQQRTGKPGHDVRILMDCGPGVVHNMARLDASWQGITHLLLTHFHNDHIGDVPMLFFAWKHGMRPGRTAPLTVIGPKGTKKKIERMADVFGDHLSEPPFELRIDEVEDGDERKLGDVARLRVRHTKHTDNSVAYRIEADGRSMCYTGDTGMSEDVAKFAQGVDVLLIECSLPDDQPMETHLTPQQVAAMARIALPKRLLLTHIYPQVDRPSLAEQVRLGGWPARVEIPSDGDSLTI